MCGGPKKTAGRAAAHEAPAQACLCRGKARPAPTGAQGLGGRFGAWLLEEEPLRSTRRFFIKQRKQRIRALAIKSAGIWDGMLNIMTHTITGSCFLIFFF